jgi:predicted short-subunit dehydrogenase-like oxidoreductase (DUF2520 family)
LSLALAESGWDVADPVNRGDDPTGAAHGVDLLVIATPDVTIADMADTVEPDDSTVVAHLAGSLGLDALGVHTRRASLHPLVALPSAEVGAQRLREHAWFAVAGDPLVLEVVDALGGRAFEVADERRALYHAAACIASNHLVALLGQAERVAHAAEVPLEAYLDLVRASVENVATLGPAFALTGPAARGDEATLDRHRAAMRAAGISDDDLRAYDDMVVLARRLVG